MGQLERYGLYVLVLVIFLILGVAIWGEDPAEAGGPKKSNVGEKLARHELGAEDDTQEEPLSRVLSGRFELDDLSDLDDDEGDPGSELDFGDLEDDDDSAGAGGDTDDDDREGGGAGTRPNPDPEPRALREYTIRDGDTLTEISQRMLGTSRQWQRILAVNPELDPRRMRAGAKIRIPHRQQGGAREDLRTPSRTEYVVKSGDNPSTIAKAVLGSQKYAADIMRANGIDDPMRLRPGQVLKIPAVRKD